MILAKITFFPFHTTALDWSRPSDHEIFQDVIIIVIIFSIVTITITIISIIIIIKIMTIFIIILIAFFSVSLIVFAFSFNKNRIFIINITEIIVFYGVINKIISTYINHNTRVKKINVILNIIIKNFIINN